MNEKKQHTPVKTKDIIIGIDRQYYIVLSESFQMNGCSGRVMTLGCDGNIFHSDDFLDIDEVIC